MVHQTEEAEMATTYGVEKTNGGNGMRTIYYIQINGKTAPVVPAYFMTIVILRAYAMGYHTFTVKEA